LPWKSSKTGFFSILKRLSRQATSTDSAPEITYFACGLRINLENDRLARILVHFKLRSLIEACRQIYPALFVIRNLNLEWK